MKILLDENLDWRLGRDLPGHEVASVPLIGWAGLKNGALLSQAAEQFEVFITMDSNMSYQQNAAKYKIAIIVLRAPSNRLVHTRPLMPNVLMLLPNIQRGKFTTVSEEGIL